MLPPLTGFNPSVTWGSPPLDTPGSGTRDRYNRSTGRPQRPRGQEQKAEPQARTPQERDGEETDRQRKWETHRERAKAGSEKMRSVREMNN